MEKFDTFVQPDLLSIVLNSTYDRNEILLYCSNVINDLLSPISSEIDLGLILRDRRRT
jgi:hypothetical protein